MRGLPFNAAKQARLTLALPLIVLAGCLCITAFIRHAEIQRLHADAVQDGQHHVLRAAREISQAIDLEKRLLRELNGKIRDIENLDNDTLAILTQKNPEHDWKYGAIAFVDAAGVVVAVEGADEQVTVGTNLLEREAWAEQLNSTRRTRKAKLSDPIHHSSGTIDVWISVPAFDSRSGRGYVGATIGKLRLTHLIAEELNRHDLANHHLRVLDGDSILYSTGNRTASESVATIDSFEQDGRVWTIAVHTQPTTEGGILSDSPLLILICGTIASVLVSGLIFFSLFEHWRAAARDRQQSLALESLSQITAVMTSRLGAHQELLDYLASSASKLLETDQACILLFNEQHRELRVMANIGFPATEVGQVLPLEGSPMCAFALRKKKIIASEDLLNDRRPNNIALTREQGVRSMLFIPMYVQTNPVGLLLLGSTKLRRFSEKNLRLAELLSSQVAVTITNNQLYEQMGESLRAQQRLQLQRERLTAITLAVYQASSLDESLKRLVDLAPNALEMDLCMVGLIDSNAQSVRVAAATSPYERMIGTEFDIAGRNSEKVLKSRQILVIEDGAADLSIHERLRAQVRVGSIVYSPLYQSDGSPLGLLVLIRHTAGPFSPEQLRMAEVFANRASGAIESARLYQQTRRDAETKAMLLRELNHRVKNNLAGIVGLLSARPRNLNLSTPAQLWLDGVIERISIMGRAHELFVGGPQMVGLSELIDQLLPTLSIVKPTGVRIMKDLDGVSLKLSTERAVALAMVLHELCRNAIAHGLGEHGTITIRARARDNDVSIEVADDGVGLNQRFKPEPAPVLAEIKLPATHPAGEDHNARMGWGLRLVEGLVARELRGRFSMSSSGDLARGTVARIDFPIGSDIDDSRNP